MFSMSRFSGHLNIHAAAVRWFSIWRGIKMIEKKNVKTKDMNSKRKDPDRIEVDDIVDVVDQVVSLSDSSPSCDAGGIDCGGFD